MVIIAFQASTTGGDLHCLLLVRLQQTTKTFSMELTFGNAQVYTSNRLKKHPSIAQVFNKVFGYTNVGNYARFTIFKKLIKQVGLPTQAKILDVGTGYGEYAISLAKALPKAEINALDIDLDRIGVLNEAISKLDLTNLRTFGCKVDQLSMAQFDFIFSIDVFEHIAPENMPFQSCYDKLLPGGKFMVKIPNNEQRTILPEKYFEEHQEWLDEEHIGQVYNLEGLVERFKSHGFDIEHASYSDGWLSRLGWELAYLGKKIGIVGQLLSLPIAKLFIHLDRVFHHNRWGNAIQVIGKKPLS